MACDFYVFYTETLLFLNTFGRVLMKLTCTFVSRMYNLGDLQEKFSTMFH